MPGVALDDIHLRFAWQAWYLWDWAGSGDALGSAVAPRYFCVAGVALGDIRVRGSDVQGTLLHPTPAHPNPPSINVRG